MNFLDKILIPNPTLDLTNGAPIDVKIHPLDCGGYPSVAIRAQWEFFFTENKKVLPGLQEKVGALYATSSFDESIERIIELFPPLFAAKVKGSILSSMAIESDKGFEEHLRAVYRKILPRFAKAYHAGLFKEYVKPSSGRDNPSFALDVICAVTGEEESVEGNYDYTNHKFLTEMVVAPICVLRFMYPKAEGEWVYLDDDTFLELTNKVEKS